MGNVTKFQKSCQVYFLDDEDIVDVFLDVSAKIPMKHALKITFCGQ